MINVYIYISDGLVSVPILTYPYDDRRLTIGHMDSIWPRFIFERSVICELANSVSISIQRVKCQAPVLMSWGAHSSGGVSSKSNDIIIQLDALWLNISLLVITCTLFEINRLSMLLFYVCLDMASIKYLQNLYLIAMINRTFSSSFEETYTSST